MNQNQLPNPKPSSSLQIFLILVTACILLVLSIDSLWSASSDLAHHYALAARIAEYWTLPPGTDPTLGEMNNYPRTGHLLAALAGSFFGSPLIGIHLVSVLSIIVLWASVCFILLSLPQSAGLKSAACLALLLLLNRSLLKLDLHGIEIVGNFFYSQLVAQAFIALGLAVALTMDLKGVKAVIRNAFLIALIYFATGIHLLPAAQLLCFLLLLIVFEAFIHLNNKKKEYVKTLLVAAGFMGVAVLVLTRHPAYVAMKVIAQNNGELYIRFFNSMGVISLYCVFIATLSGLLVFQWFRLNRREPAQYLSAVKYIGLYGLAVSGLCLVQVMSLKFGQGSEYAVKKHLFTLNTVVLVELALLPILVNISKYRHAQWQDSSGLAVFYSYLLLPLLTVLAFYNILPHKKFLDTSDLVKVEHQLQTQRDALASATPSKHVYLLGTPEILPSVAYMMSIGILKAPRTANSINILLDQPLSELNLVGTILAAESSYAGQFKTCRRPFPALPFVVIDGECFAREMGQGQRIVGLSVAHGTPPCLLEGFSTPENSGRWTNQQQARLQCPVPDLNGKAPEKLLIDTSAFLQQIKFQRVSFSINGGPQVEYRYDAEHPTRIIELPLATKPGKDLDIRFSLPDAVSPKQLGMSEDPRQLGLMVRTIEFK